MFASPFFTAGRNSILPGIATPEELHTANTMTQTTSWASLTAGAFLGAVGAQYGFKVAFGFNALSFVISALCISQLKRPGGFKPVAGLSAQQSETGLRAVSRRHPVHALDARWCSGLRMLSVGWATGGGAAQILFSLFGEKVFNAGPMGIGVIWGFAGIGLLIGGSIAYWLGKRLSFVQYKRTIAIAYVIHGGAYILFSQMPTIALGLRVHLDLARGHRGQCGTELLAVVAARGRPIPGPRVRYAGIVAVGDHDDLDDGGGRGDDRVQPAGDRGVGGGGQLHDGDLLDVGELDRAGCPNRQLQPVLPIEEKEIHAEPQVAS